MIDFPKLKVEILPRDKGLMLGQAAIEYYGLRITHFRIMKDKDSEEIYLQTPSIRVFNKYQRCFWILEKDDVEVFDKLILDAYVAHIAKIKAGAIEDNTPITEIRNIPDL